MQNDLEVTDLCYAFPGFDLGPLSLRLAPGRVYGLLGPNGAGKSTLINLLTQQLMPVGGRIAFGGREVRWNDRGWKARFAYIRETPQFYDELHVQEVLAFAGRIYDGWDAGLAERLTERFGLDPRKRVATLSKGNRVKLGLVAGLAADVDLLILDEPTAGLDPTVRTDLQQTLRELMDERRDNRRIVLSSHLFEDLERVADEVLVLRDGRIVFRTARDDLDAMVLVRCENAAGVDVEEAVLAWRVGGAEWMLVRRASALAETLAHRPDCHEEKPASMLEAVYHGIQRAR